MGSQRRAPSSVQRTSTAHIGPSQGGRARGLLGSALACALLFTVPATAVACEPADQFAAERRAREISRDLSRNASVEARKILRRAKRELRHLEGKARDLEGRARRGVKKARKKSGEARDLLHKLQPPAESSAPAHTDSAILCDGDTCTIDQKTASIYGKDPMMLLHEGTIIPLPGVGSAGGIKILSLRDGGLGERLGLRPGDVLRDIDGVPLTSLFSDPETRKSLGRSRSWTLTLTREGSELRKSIALR